MVRGLARGGNPSILRHPAYWVGALAVLCALSWTQQSYYDFLHDDAFIAFRYAVHWAHGFGPVYNIGDRVEGYSNFLFVAFLAGAVRLGLDPVQVSRTLGTLSCFGLVLVVFRFVAGPLRRGPVWAVAAAGALAVHASLAVWARSGLETVPFALVVLAAQDRYVREHLQATDHGRSGALFTAAALMRADGFLFAVPAALFLLSAPRPWRRLASFGAPFVLLFVPYVAWRYAYYGYPFPNSYYLKTGGGVFQQIRGLFYSYNFVVPFGGILLFSLPAILLAYRDPARDRIRLFLGASVLIFWSYIVWVGGDHMPMSRFFVPLLAPITVLLLEAAFEIQSHCGPLGRVQRRVVGAVLIACIVVAGLLPSLNSRRLPASFAISNSVLTRQWALAGKWFHDHAPPTAVLATEPAGAVAYYSELRTIDMLGVNDTHIAHLSVHGLGHGSAGHEKRDVAYVLAQRPDFIFHGVREDSTIGGIVREYGAGCAYRMRCAPLGRGAAPGDFGTVHQADLYLWYEARDCGPEPDAKLDGAALR